MVCRKRAPLQSMCLPTASVVACPDISTTWPCTRTRLELTWSQAKAACQLASPHVPASAASTGGQLPWNVLRQGRQLVLNLSATHAGHVVAAFFAHRDCRSKMPGVGGHIKWGVAYNHSDTL